MESYYDSDEEIAWGPLTLKEIRKELSTKRPVKERHSIHISKPIINSLNTTIYHSPEEDLNKKSVNDNNDNTTYRTISDGICCENSNIDESSFKTASKGDETSYHSSNNYVISNDNHDEDSGEKLLQSTGSEIQIIDISSDDKENVEEVDKLTTVKQENSSNLQVYPDTNVETIDLSSEDEAQASNHINNNSSDNSSYVFNDTLEEMENALKELQTPSFSNKIEQKICHEKNFITTRKPPPPPLQLNKYDYIVSPIGEYIRERSPTVEKFKTPKPITKRTITTPSSINKQLRNIVSPVALYIKNTPTTPLRQNVQLNSKVCMPENRVLTTQTGSSSNMAVGDLPKAMYKPSKRTVQNDVNVPNLPSSIKNMVSLPVVTTHMKKTKQIDGSLIENMADEDLTLAGDATVDSSIDISFYQNKQVFIK